MRHYLWMVLIALVVSGCASNSDMDLRLAIYDIADRSEPELNISDSEHEWKSNRSYASNILAVSGGQSGLFDSFTAESAHVEATTASRVGWAAFNWLSGSNVLETASLDSVRAKNSKDAEFNPFIMLFVGEVEFNEGLADATPVEYLRGKLESQLQLAINESFGDSKVSVMTYNQAVIDYAKTVNLNLYISDDTTYIIEISGPACHIPVEEGHAREPYGSIENPDPRFDRSVFVVAGKPELSNCSVHVSAESLGWQVLPWSSGARTHGFRVDTSEQSLSTTLATWVPSLSASSHLTWVVGNRWYSGTKYMRSQFPFVTGGGHAWLFTVGNDSIPLDDFQKMTGQTE